MAPTRVKFNISLIFWVAAGLLLRLVLIVQSGWRIDYDEAMIGLLGLRVLRGEWVAFIPGQATLGALGPYLLALSFKVFGATLVGFRLVSLVFSAGYILTTGLLAQRAYGARVGAAAAMLAAIAPPYMLITGLKTWGGTIETIVLGNILLLTIAYTAEKAGSDRKRRVGLALAGLVAGVMFWLAWLCFYYFVPVALLLAWRGRRALRAGWWVALLAFLVGSAPFWIFNLQESFSTFATILNASPTTLEQTGAVFPHLTSDLIPRLATGAPSWQTSGLRGRFVLVTLYYAGVLSLLIWPRWGRWRQRPGSSLRWMLAVFVVALPIIYVFSGYGRNALNPWGLDATGRYVLMLHTALPIGLAALGVAIGRGLWPGSWLLGTGMVLLVVGLNLLGCVRLDKVQAFDSPYYDRLPPSLSPLIDYLDENGVSHVWADVGIAHVLMFQTGERILAADYYDAYIAGGLVRFPDVLAKVGAAPRVAFVIPVQPGQQNPPLERALDAAGISCTQARVTPTLAVYIPDRPIDPALIAGGLGWQY